MCVCPRVCSLRVQGRPRRAGGRGGFHRVRAPEKFAAKEGADFLARVCSDDSFRVEEGTPETGARRTLPGTPKSAPALTKHPDRSKLLIPGARRITTVRGGALCGVIAESFPPPVFQILDINPTKPGGLSVKIAPVWEASGAPRAGNRAQRLLCARDPTAPVTADQFRDTLTDCNLRPNEKARRHKPPFWRFCRCDSSVPQFTRSTLSCRFLNRL